MYTLRCDEGINKTKTTMEKKRTDRVQSLIDSMTDMESPQLENNIIWKYTERFETLCC